MHRTMRSAVAALSLAALAAAPTFADRGPGGPPHGELDGAFGERLAERHAERLTRALDLSEAQQETLAALQQSFGETVRPIVESMRATREELESLLAAARPDAAAVGAKAIALHQAKESMRAAHETFEAGIESMLTETQRAQFEALQEARPERGRFGRHRSPRGR